VAGYSGYRIFEETIRIDSSEYFLGMRLNFWVALVMTLIGLAWFIRAQRRSADAQIAWPAEAAAAPATAGIAAEAGVDGEGGAAREGGAGESSAASGSGDPGGAGSQASPERDSAVTPGSTQ
jgi:hypothetical protein